MKRIKISLIIILSIILIMTVFLFIPIKFAVKSNEIDKNKEYYVLKYIHGDVTDGGCWVYECQDNQKIQNPVKLKGSVPFERLSNSILYEYDNWYVVYGSLTTQTAVTTMGIEYEDHIINVEDWDILSDINGGLHKSYITIYDMNWFPWFSDKTEKWRPVNERE